MVANENRVCLQCSSNNKQSVVISLSPIVGIQLLDFMNADKSFNFAEVRIYKSRAAKPT